MAVSRTSTTTAPRPSRSPTYGTKGTSQPKPTYTNEMGGYPAPGSPDWWQYGYNPQTGDYVGTGNGPNGPSDSYFLNNYSAPPTGSVGGMLPPELQQFLQSVGLPPNNEGLFQALQQPNLRQYLQNFNVPNLEQYLQGMTAYDPRQEYSGVIPPSLERMLQEGTVSSSEFDKIKIDPALREAQGKALSKLQEISESHGLTVEDRVRMREILDQVQRQTRMNIGAIRQRYEQSGMGGSGVELAATLSANQGATEGASELGAQVAAQASARQFQAMQEAAKLAGTIRSQDYGEAATRAGAIDAINRFNAAQRAQIYQNDFQNQFNLVEARAQAGQNFFQNQYNLRMGRADLANQTYQNQFNLSQAQMQAAQQEYLNRFNQTTSIANARNQYWSNSLAYGQAQADAAMQEWNAALQINSAKDADAYRRWAAEMEKNRYTDQFNQQQWQNDFATWNAEQQQALMKYQAQMAQAQNPDMMGPLAGATVGGIIGGPVGAAIGYGFGGQVWDWASDNLNPANWF